MTAHEIARRVIADGAGLDVGAIGEPLLLALDAALAALDDVDRGMLRRARELPEGDPRRRGAVVLLADRIDRASRRAR